MLGLEQGEPRALLCAGQLRLGALGETDEVQRVQVAPLVVGGRQLAGVLADQVEQPVAVASPPHHARVDERGQMLDCRPLTADGERRLGREAAAEDRQAAQQVPCRGLEQLVAPVERGAHRPLTRRLVACPAGEHVETRVQALEQLVGCEDAEPWSRQLDRQRQPSRRRLIAPSASASARPAPGGADPSSSSSRAADRFERLDLDHLLRGQPEHAPARRQQGQPGGSGDELAERRGRVGQVLEVVEHEQQLELA